MKKIKLLTLALSMLFPLTSCEINPGQRTSLNSETSQEASQEESQEASQEVSVEISEDGGEEDEELKAINFEVQSNFRGLRKVNNVDDESVPVANAVFKFHLDVEALKAETAPESYFDVLTIRGDFTTGLENKDETTTHYIVAIQNGLLVLMQNDELGPRYALSDYIDEEEFYNFLMECDYSSVKDFLVSVGEVAVTYIPQLLEGAMEIAMPIVGTLMSEGEMNEGFNEDEGIIIEESEEEISEEGEEPIVEENSEEVEEGYTPELETIIYSLMEMLKDQSKLLTYSFQVMAKVSEMMTNVEAASNPEEGDVDPVAFIDAIILGVLGVADAALQGLDPEAPDQYVTTLVSALIAQFVTDSDKEFLYNLILSIPVFVTLFPLHQNEYENEGKSYIEIQLNKEEMIEWFKKVELTVNSLMDKEKEYILSPMIAEYVTQIKEAINDFPLNTMQLSGWTDEEKYGLNVYVTQYNAKEEKTEEIYFDLDFKCLEGKDASLPELIELPQEQEIPVKE